MAAGEAALETPLSLALALAIMVLGGQQAVVVALILQLMPVLPDCLLEAAGVVALPLTTDLLPLALTA